MKYVGGYGDYLQLLEDERAVDDVLLYMRGEADAARTARLMAEAKRGHR